MSEILVLRPDDQKFITELYLEIDEEPRSDNESGTNTKILFELVNLDDLFDLDSNKEFLDNELVSKFDQKMRWLK